MKKNYVGIWGQYGNGGPIADGQAVRTTIITRELQDRYGKENIKILNTEGWQKNPISFLWKSVSLYLKSEKIIIAPADNGFKVVVKLYDFMNKVFKRELYDIVIGGYLPALIEKKPSYINKLKKYKGLFVQTENLKKEIEQFGLNNVYILSNLKRLNKTKKNELKLNKNDVIEVCTMSRVVEDKGIEDAIEAVRLMNNHFGRNVAKLCIYGIPGDDYKEKFESLLDKYQDIVTYGGVLKYDKTSDTLKKYFAMLFPTYYYGEGFPGNIIDAYNAGIPIIATDWNYNSEIIKDGRNGILVPIKDPESLCKALEKLYTNRELALQYSLNNIEDASLYSPEMVLKEFYSVLEA